MSATLTTPAPPPGLERPRALPLTLEQRLERSWQDLRFRGAAECPLCRGAMRRAADGSGQCSGCGSKLS